MLEEILLHIHNRVEDKGAGLSGEFVISSGTIDLPQLLPGQYFWIDGSVFNDGLHQAGSADLQDEIFRGTITPAAVPKAVVALSEDISTWVEKNPATDKTSESFGGYSYSRASGANGAPVTWQAVFASRLNRWRKLS